MPIMTDGKTRFVLEEGQSFAGWTLVRIELQGANFAIGKYAFVFEKDGVVRRIINEKWPGERSLCTDGRLSIYECPPELVIFAYRTTTIIDESRHATPTEG